MGIVEKRWVVVVSDIWIQAPASSLVSYIISWDLSKFPETQFLPSIRDNSINLMVGGLDEIFFFFYKFYLAYSFLWQILTTVVPRYPWGFAQVP